MRLHRVYIIILFSALVAAALLAATETAQAYRVIGEFNGYWLVEDPPLSTPNASIAEYSGGRALLVATTIDPRVSERLSSLRVSVTEWKKLEVVDGGWYRLGWLTEPPQPLVLQSQDGARDDAGALMLVVVPDGYEWVGERIASLHPDLHIVVMNWSSVMAGCEARTPEPPGFVKPSELEKKCGVGYNATRALCLIALERRLLAEGLRYLLLVGGASVTPPVYYYSPILAAVGVGSCPGIVPTDYWYMDPDYDWVPEVAVGRIPFLDPHELGVYLDALEDWIRGAEGASGVLVTGGAPFQYTLMLGEKAVYEASGSMAGVNVNIATLSLGGYKPLLVQEEAGKHRLYFIVSHGIGDMLLDVFPNGLWGARVEPILVPKELPLNTGAPGVYVTPACLSAYWDDDVIEPSFHPPSVAVALLSKGYAVAYYGSSRIALGAIVDIAARSDGTLDIRNIGALYLTTLAASMLVKEERIGDAIVKALAAYSSSARGVAVAYTAQGAEDVAVLTMLEFILLGDPAAPAPYTNATVATLPRARIEGARSVPAVLAYQALAGMIEGHLPLLNATEPLHVVIDGSCPGKASLIAVKRYYSYILADIEQEPVTLKQNGTSCIVSGRLDAGPSLHYLVLEYGGSVERYALLAAGVEVKPVGPGLVALSATGLDILRTTEDEPIGVYLNGRLVAWIPGAIDKTTLNMSIDEPGVVTLKPWRLYAGLVAGATAGEELETILEDVYTVRIDPPRIHTVYQPGGVLVVLHGVEAYRVEGAERVNQVEPHVILICSDKPVTLTAYIAGREWNITIPMNYNCTQHSRLATGRQAANTASATTGAQQARTGETGTATQAPTMQPAEHQASREETSLYTRSPPRLGTRAATLAYLVAAMIAAAASFIAAYAWPRR